MKTTRKLTRYSLALCCMLMLWAIPGTGSDTWQNADHKNFGAQCIGAGCILAEGQRASGYELYRKSGSGSFQKVASVAGINQCTCTDGKLKADTLYTYQVRAYRSVSARSSTAGHRRQRAQERQRKSLQSHWKK